jgi:SAM-dependent methyltransferase
VIDPAADRERAFWDAAAAAESATALVRGVRADAAAVETARRLAGAIRSSDVVVDLGCGTGEVTRGLAPFCRRAVGVDWSRVAVGEARRRETARNVHWLATDGRSLAALADDGADFVVATLLMLHLGRARAGALVAEVARVLRPGGGCRFEFHDDAAIRGLATRHALSGAPHELVAYDEPAARALFERGGLRCSAVDRRGDVFDLTARRPLTAP